LQESKKTNYDVVVLCGSPHKEGNTVAILQLLFKELSNITKTIHFAYELHVHPCIDCGFCHNEFGCIFHDDMDMLYATIKQSTFLIVASPLYFSHLPSPLKAIIDRCQVFWEYYKNNPSQTKRHAMAILIGGGNYYDMFMPGKITLRHYFNSLQYHYDEDNFLLLPNINSKNDIENADIMKKVEQTTRYILTVL